MTSDCKKMEFLIQLSIDGEITEEDEHRLEQHLKTCIRCRKEMAGMIRLVYSLEQLGKSERTFKRCSPYRVKWVLFIASVVLLSMMASPAYPVSHFGKSATEKWKNEQAVWPLTVLATESEARYIPKDIKIKRLEPTQWKSPISGTALVYPSAVPSFIQQPHFREQIDSMIFVRVPDFSTLRGLLDAIGLTNHTISSSIQFPVSVMVTPSSSPKIKIFHFPKTKEGVEKWFEDWASGLYNFQISG